MLRHGLSPDGMPHGTMVSMPKGRWTNVSLSDNVRAITLIYCNILLVLWTMNYGFLK